MSESSKLKGRENTFTPEDLKLFYESPFASWMEQLDREFPDHGIAPDLLVADGAQGTAGQATPLHNKAFFQQLIDNGNQVVAVNEQATSAERQLNTLNAMRAGANFIFSPFISVLPLVGMIDFLVRTPGQSVFGDFHYTPAQFYFGEPDLTSMPVELCCFVDMLEHLQGTRPEEVLRVRATDSANPRIDRLPGGEYMFDYRKLKIRYRQAQVAFNRDEMPDPAESRHWGRWSRYARQILARRAREQG